jgi:oligosaccharide repeat unit polymerase
MNPTFVMIINFSLYFGTFLWSIKKYHVAISSLLWLVYSIFAAFSVYLCYTKLYWDYQETASSLTYSNLNILPYILNYICVFFIINPIKKINYNNLSFNRIIYKKNDINLLSFILVIELMYTILKLFQLKIAIIYGLGNMHDLGGNTIDNLYYGNNIILKYFNYIGKFCTKVIMPFIFIYIINGYIRKFISKRLLIVFTAFYVINTLIVGLTTGSRAELFFSMFTLISYIVLFWYKITLRNRKIITSFTILLFIIIYFFTSQITSQRVINDKRSSISAVDNLIKYCGESYLNLGFEFWNNAKFTNGNRMFGEILGLFNHTQPKEDGYWIIYTGTRIDYFKTIYGDLYVEFGIIKPVFFCLILSLIIKLYLKGKEIGCEKICFINLYLITCIGGIFNFVGFNTIIDITYLLLALYTSSLLKKRFMNKDNHTSRLLKQH